MGSNRRVSGQPARIECAMDVVRLPCVRVSPRVSASRPICCGGAVVVSAATIDVRLGRSYRHQLRHLRKRADFTNRTVLGRARLRMPRGQSQLHHQSLLAMRRSGRFNGVYCPAGRRAAACHSRVPKRLCATRHLHIPSAVCAANAARRSRRVGRYDHRRGKRAMYHGRLCLRVVSHRATFVTHGHASSCEVVPSTPYLDHCRFRRSKL